jgi:hypothetical protein
MKWDFPLIGVLLPQGKRGPGCLRRREKICTRFGVSYKEGVFTHPMIIIKQQYFKMPLTERVWKITYIDNYYQ